MGMMCVIEAVRRSFWIFFKDLKKRVGFYVRSYGSVRTVDPKLFSVESVDANKKNRGKNNARKTQTSLCGFQRGPQMY